MEAVAKSLEVTAANRATRVLLVAPPAAGGLASHVIALLRGLGKGGYDLHVVCEPEGRIAVAAADLGIPADSMTCTVMGGPPRVALRALKLARIIRGFRPHIVHTHSFGASMTGTAACILARSARLVVTIHNYPPGMDTMTPAGRGSRWAFRRVIERAVHIITVSDVLRRDIAAMYPQAMPKSSTIYNGVETHVPISRSPADIRAEHGFTADGPFIGMIARLAPQKGIKEFIGAARIIADAYPTAVFALAGDGPLLNEAVNLRRELGLERQLHLLGHVDWARELIATLDVLVVASLSEGSSVVAMEAMALSKPVVATAVGGVPEVVASGETGLLVPPGDVQALAGAVIEILSDSERAGEMGERGRQRAVRQFDINDMIEKTKAIYADIMRGLPKGEGARR